MGNAGDCKHIVDQIFELREHYGPGYRIYWGRDKDTIVVLLCGGTKQNQKKDIKLAEEYWKDYKKRGEYNER